MIRAPALSLPTKVYDPLFDVRGFLDNLNGDQPSANSDLVKNSAIGSSPSSGCVCVCLRFSGFTSKGPQSDVDTPLNIAALVARGGGLPLLR